jgi:hypothetical protein
MEHGPSASFISVPIWAGARASGDRRMSAATVRITSITTNSSSCAAVPGSTPPLPAALRGRGIAGESTTIHLHG